MDCVLRPENIKMSLCFVLLINLVYYVTCNTYMGEKFPSKYLVPDDYIPTQEDANIYFESLTRVVGFFQHDFSIENDTSIDRALGAFYVTAILKRVIHDYGDNMDPNQIEALRNITGAADQHVWLFTYQKKMIDDNNLEFKISKLMRDNYPQVHSLSPFTRNLLKKWLLSTEKINHLNTDFDTAVLPKEKFIELTNSWHTYNLGLSDLDECMAQAGSNSDPIDLAKWKPCRVDTLCRSMIARTPAVTYSLSHRVMTLLMFRQIRHCYIYSNAKDEELIDKLCSFMYREAVYIARRGYFARDVFMEHVVLCGFMGYEEFYRHEWLRKISSWIDEEGCVEENHNFLINKTKIIIEYYKPRGEDMIERIKLGHKRTLANECQRRPMVLAMVAMAHAVRHAIHYVSKSE